MLLAPLVDFIAAAAMFILPLPPRYASFIFAIEFIFRDFQALDALYAFAIFRRRFSFSMPVFSVFHVDADCDVFACFAPPFQPSFSFLHSGFADEPSRGFLLVAAIATFRAVCFLLRFIAFRRLLSCADRRYFEFTFLCLFFFFFSFQPLAAPFRELRHVSPPC